jgi:hypothetical protein
MPNIYSAFAAVLLLVASWLLWCAYQVHHKGRTDLIRLGSKPLPGAERLKGQFSVLFLLQGLASALTAVAFLALESLQPTVWVFFAATGALSLRRSLLIAGLERYARAASGEA